MPFVYARIDDEIMNWIRVNTDDRTGMKKSNCDNIQSTEENLLYLFALIVIMFMQDRELKKKYPKDNR